MKNPLSTPSLIDGTRRSQKFLFVALIAAGVFMFIVSGAAWAYLSINNSDKIFWGAIRNNLQTTSFVRSSFQGDEFQSVEQVTRTQTSPELIAIGSTTISQSGDNAATAVTETIGTPFADYVRYERIETGQTDAQGNTPDFSEITGLWGKNGDETAGLTTGQLVNESVLGIIPYAYVPADRRAELLSLIKDTDVYTAVHVGTEGSGIRKTYVYKVTVNPVAYVTALKAFAAAIGLNHLSDVDPSQYASVEPIVVDVHIDNLSRQIKEIVYSGGVRTEKISGYGIISPLKQPPTEAISMQELQYRLQTIQ